MANLQSPAVKPGDLVTVHFKLVADCPNAQVSFAVYSADPNDRSNLTKSEAGLF